MALFYYRYYYYYATILLQEISSSRLILYVFQGTFTFSSNFSAAKVVDSDLSKTTARE